MIKIHSIAIVGLMVCGMIFGMIFSEILNPKELSPNYITIHTKTRTTKIHESIGAVTMVNDGDILSNEKMSEILWLEHWVEMYLKGHYSE